MWDVSLAMRVLHVIGDSDFGGGAYVIGDIARMALGLGWQVDVLTTNPEFQSFLREQGIGVVDLDVIRREIRPGRDVCGCFRLWRFLCGAGYPFVHTHTSKGGFVGRLAARLAQVPVIVHTAHGFAFHEASSSFETMLWATLERLAARWCDRIVTVSGFHRQWALRLRIGSPGQVVAIPNGIGAERVSPNRTAMETRAALGLDPSSLAVVTTGRLAEQKGLRYLVAAVPALVAALGDRFRLLLAGEGRLRSSLERQAQALGIAEYVSFLGFRRDVGDVLSASDIVVLPSYREGLSIALLEAMAMGKPVVATEIGSNREVLQDGSTGLLVPARSTDALQRAVLELALDADLRERLGRAAKRDYLERYSSKRMADQYHALYLELCRQKGLCAV